MGEITSALAVKKFISSFDAATSAVPGASSAPEKVNMRRSFHFVWWNVYGQY